MRLTFVLETFDLVEPSLKHSIALYMEFMGGMLGAVLFVIRRAFVNAVCRVPSQLNKLRLRVPDVLFRIFPLFNPLNVHDDDNYF